MPKPDPKVTHIVRKTRGYALPDRLPPPTTWQGKLERWRRTLGIQYPRRRFVIIREPVRVELFLSRRPSLSIRKDGMTVNVSRQGIRPTVRGAYGIGRRFSVIRWSRLHKQLPAARKKGDRR